MPNLLFKTYVYIWVLESPQEDIENIDLEGQGIVSRHMCAENKTWALCKDSKRSLVYT